MDRPRCLGGRSGDPSQPTSTPTASARATSSGTISRSCAFIRRFTRLSLGFSKKFENLCAAVALHVAHYNFCRKQRYDSSDPPAMAAKVTRELWSMERFIGEIGI